MRKNKSYR